MSALVAAVAAARRRTIDGRFWHQGPTRHPLDACADPAVTGGRFHRAGGVGVWYASSQEQAAWAELFRHFVDDGVDPFEVIRRAGSVDVADLVVLDLTDPTVCVALGVTEDDLVADDYTLCQDIAAAAHAAGFDGILAPAAALPGRRTLAIFATAMRKVVPGPSRVRQPPPRMADLLAAIRPHPDVPTAVRRLFWVIASGGSAAIRRLRRR